MKGVRVGYGDYMRLRGRLEDEKAQVKIEISRLQHKLKEIEDKINELDSGT